MPKIIKLFDPTIGKKEKDALIDVLESHSWASGSGSGLVSKFETKFNKFVGSDVCVAVSSGTAALHLALSLFDIKNREVILPSLTFVSTAHVIKYNGGIPIFVDVDENTLCIDPKKIKKHVTKKTKVILPVHFGGIPSNLAEIKSFSKDLGIFLVEDAAHAAGTFYNGRRIGSHGNAVCFSFHPVKNLAMPKGGAITFNGKENKKFLKIIKSKRWCGISDRKGSTYDIGYLGWNYYMTEFSAAIGLEQLKKLDKMNKKRRKIAKKYNKEICLENKMPYDKNSSYHLYWIRVKNRNDFIKKMQKDGIQTGIHYKPLHQTSFYKRKIKLPITDKVGNQIVSIPMHANLSESDVDIIIKKINKFC